MNEAATTKQFDVMDIRKDFPILHQEINGYPLAYFDNAATTQKPQSVIDAITGYYAGYNANIHRGIHTLAEKATGAFEETRKTLQEFINAREAEEIVFTKGTTDSINLVASSWGRANIREGDEIIISGMEHHSNIVPWQMLCEDRKAVLKVIPVNETGELDLEAYRSLLSEKTKLVAVVHASNSLGTVNPVKEIIKAAHEFGALVLLDGAQASSHLEIDVQDLDVDFYAASAHKVFGPSGTGMLYGKRKHLEAMPPYQGGGEMIKEVTFEQTTYNDIPYKFEAGTPNIADVIAYKEAIDYVNAVGKKNISAHENRLTKHASEGLSALNAVRLIGTAKDKVSVVSFVVDGIHHFDIGQLLDARGIAVRTGHHCTQPLMDRYGIEGTVRASFSLYNTTDEIDRLLEGMERIISRMKK